MVARAELAQRAESVRDREVAITGRLASMTRRQAAAWIDTSGGRYVDEPSDGTHLLVIGQHGWPLRADGHLTASLRRVHELQRAGHQIEILTESEFLGILGLDDRRADLGRLFTIGQLGRILDVPTGRIRAWMRQELIRPVKVVRQLCWFDFRQVASAKALLQLLHAGATPARVRRSLAMLRSAMPDVELPLMQLAAIERGGHVVVRRDDGSVVEASGQLRFDFGRAPRESDGMRPLRSDLFRHEARDPQTWFEIGVRAEDAGEYERAADAYQQALISGGPHAAIAFNLGNVLHALARPGEAAQRFLQAVEIEPDYVEAWNNLGIALGELERHADAISAFRRALAFEPGYADAHFNLAEALENGGRQAEARPHWEAYLRQDPGSSEGRYAARRLRESRRE